MRAATPLDVCIHHILFVILQKPAILLLVRRSLMKSRARHFRFALVALVLAALFLVVQAVPGQAADSTAAASGPNPETSEPFYSATNGIGSWIWASETFPDQTCQLWHTFEVPNGSSVTNARLIMTGDDEFTLYLDGRELGHGVDWRELFSFDLTPLLTSGRHVLAIRAYNSFSFAGVIFKLQVRLTDGQVVDVKSDESWRIVPNSVKRWETRAKAADNWPAATVQAPMGGGPWSEPWPVTVVGMPALQPVRLAFWQTGWFQVLLLVVVGAAVLISLRLMTQLAFHRRERWLLQQERTRIAREIHDDIGSRMTQLVLHGEVAQRELREGSEMQQRLAEICEESRGVLATMDEILWAVNPQRDTLRDFAPYVCKYAEEFLQPTQIQCLFEVEPEMPAVDFNLALRRSLLMAIKEALNNAVKYSGASEMRIRINWCNQQLNVAVQDNGRGFDPALVKADRHGMTNMRERLVEMGGSCRVISEPGNGCRIEFNIPLKRSRGGFRAWFAHATRRPPPAAKSGSHRPGESAAHS